MQELDEFTNAYLFAALWSTLDMEEEETYLDETHTIKDFTGIKAVQADCLSFLSLYAGLIPCGHLAQAGHDFWLTRNGHGAGFFDRENVYGRLNAKKLTEAVGYNTEFPPVNIIQHENGTLTID